MSHATHLPVRMCRVLEIDSDLAEAVPEPRRREAIRDCVALEVALAPGVPSSISEVAGGGVGLLVLNGLLIRRVGIDGRFGAELLGPGDILRPWQGEDEPMLATTTGWRVLDATRVAILDERFARAMAPFPQLAGRLVGRALQRARNLAVNMAIVHQPRVDVRVHMLLWHLAGRWGIVSGRGVRLPLRLTHSVLGELTAARRPTVTTALSELARRDLLRTEDGGWLLCGNPPWELMEISPSPAPPLTEPDGAASGES